MNNTTFQFEIPKNIPSHFIYPTLFVIQMTVQPVVWNQALGGGLEFTTHFHMWNSSAILSCPLKNKWTQLWNLHGRLPDPTSHITAKISAPRLCGCSLGNSASKARLLLLINNNEEDDLLFPLKTSVRKMPNQQEIQAIDIFPISPPPHLHAEIQRLYLRKKKKSRTSCLGFGH